MIQGAKKFRLFLTEVRVPQPSMLIRTPNRDRVNFAKGLMKCMLKEMFVILFGKVSYDFVKYSERIKDKRMQKERRILWQANVCELGLARRGQLMIPI